jgi:predicted dehydrogenase
MDARDAEASWVVIGSGSAGRRHAAALRRRSPDASIVVVRRPESHQPTDALEGLGVRIVASLTDAVAAVPTVAIVAGPAPVHAEAAVPLLEAGADVLVEKPLAADRADGEAMRQAAVARGRSLCVGYHLRFDDAAAAFRAGVEQLGSVASFELHVGQHLDQWRPGVDASRSVTARQELGGGVLLELSHEIDAARWCFGPIASVRAHLRHDGAPTDGRVETVADLDVEVAGGGSGTIHLDMVSEVPRRTWRASGPDGTVEADLLAGTVRGTGAAAAISTTVEPGWRDRAEDALLADLFAVHGGGAGAGASVDDALAALDVIAAARLSAEAGGPMLVGHELGSAGSVR